MNAVHGAGVSSTLKTPIEASEISAICGKVGEDALEARALNLRQARLIANATPEPDSLLEHVVELAKTATPEQRDHLTAILTLIRALASSNSQEGELQRAVIGASEQLAVELRDRRVANALGVKNIARALRRPLNVIGKPDRFSAGQYVEAIAAVNDVIAQVPQSKLLALSVRHELGVRSYSTLVEYVQNREATA